MKVVLPQVPCCVSCGVIQHPLLEEIRLHPAILTALDQLQAVDVAFDGPVRPGERQGGFDRDLGSAVLALVGLGVFQWLSSKADALRPWESAKAEEEVHKVKGDPLSREEGLEQSLREPEKDG